MSSLVFYPNTLHSDYLGQWRSYPRFVLNGNYLDLVSKQSAAPAEMIWVQDSALEQEKSRRGDPPNPPLEHRCSYIEDGKPCQWSFNRRYDRDRHEKTHLRADARLENHCPHEFKNLQLGNLRTHIKTVHRDIQHLICQVCRPFVLTADPAGFKQHQAEKHGGPHPAPLPRIVPNPTPPTTPASSPPALSRSTTPERITLVPLATLLCSRPTPTPPMPPTISFIVRAQPTLPAEGPCLQPIIVPHRSREARKPYCGTHSRAIPTLRDFLRNTCGIELTQCHRPTHHRLPSPPTSSSSESELTRSGSPSSSFNDSGFSSPIDQATTSTTALQWPGPPPTPNQVGGS
ncbi:hypothetical protein EV421DRAFT_1975370 [Armillaria borealis]|uniref:Uncharacterized protein n=1 Tax=Armillaria borealis TaxID=47425 RepID=A0AA39ML25_9AGAR|nr:hypothetical protein EV421DRAFT_1975370 [Armillaria borealis]